MICEICKENGEKSKVFSRDGSSTLMGYTPYYDEEGIHHIHDGNRRTFTYNCSNNHSWSRISYSSCFNCDWTGGETEINYFKIPVKEFSNKEKTKMSKNSNIFRPPPPPPNRIFREGFLGERETKESIKTRKQWKIEIQEWRKAFENEKENKNE